MAEGTTGGTTQPRPLQGEILRTVGGSIGARLVTGAAALLTIPLLVGELGAERFGIYAVLTTMSGLVGFIDGGIGSGVRTRAAEAETDDEASVAIAAGLILLTAAAVVTLAAGGAAALAIPWGSLLGAEGVIDAATMRAGVAVSVVAFASTLPSLVVLRVLEGRGASAAVSSSTAAPGLVILSGSALIIALGGGFLPLVAAANFAALAAPLTLLIIRRRLVPAPRFDPRRMRSEIAAIWHISWPMIIVSTALGLSYALDPMVVAWGAGPSGASEYALASRLSQLVTLVVFASGPVLWTHFARARAAGPPALAEVRFLSRWYLLVISVLGGVLTVSGPALTAAWSGGPVVAPWTLFAATAAWASVLAFQLPYAMAQNDRSGLKFQAASTMLMAAVNVPLSLVLVRTVGVSGPVWASALTLGLFHAAPLVWRLQRRC